MAFIVNNLQEYNTNLHQFSSKLVTDAANNRETISRLETEKLATVDTHNKLHSHNVLVKEQLTNSKVRLDQKLM